MGACNISGKFEDIDWKIGIEKIQREAEAYYGHQEGYNGAENSVDFCFKGNHPELKTTKQITSYIHERLKAMNKRDGEIICVGIDSYKIITTKFAESKQAAWHPAAFYDSVTVKSRSATLVRIYNDGSSIEAIAAGTVADMKKKAHECLRKNMYRYNCTYEIVCHRAKQILSCDADVKIVKATKKKTNDKYMVLPVYKYVYYGWAAE